MAFWSSAGQAVVPSKIALQARGACPAAKTIQRQLKPLLPHTSVRLVTRPGVLTAAVADEGARFSISVGGAERSIEETARDCVERARISAVFIALVLDPPLVSLARTSARSPVVSEQEVPPGEPTSAPPGYSVTTAVRVSAALGRPGSRDWGLGPSLGLSVSGERSELVARGATLSPFKLEFARGTVRLVRIPFDVGYHYLLRGGGFSGYLGLGVAADLLHISGEGFERSLGAVRVGVGASGALGVRYSFDPTWSGFAEFSGAYFPRPYRLEVEPERLLGKTPRAWLGVTMGAIFRAD